MQLVRDLQVLRWDDAMAQVAIDYLQSRGFMDATVSPGPVINGTRGSWRGNFTSFDMTKLRAKVRLSPAAVGLVTVDLDVNTVGQQITQWNAATWRLEIAELHRVLCGLGPISDVWARFKQDSRSAAQRWSITLGIGGQTLPESWETEIRNLENSCTPASRSA